MENRRLKRMAGLIVTGLMALAAMLPATAADKPVLKLTPTPAAETTFSVGAIGAFRTERLTHETTLGAGLDAGWQLNRRVSLHGSVVGYETGDWGGLMVDESEVYARAQLWRSTGGGLELYAKGGGARDWERERWGMSAGLGAEWRLSRVVGLGVDYSVRMWAKDGPLDGLLRTSLNFRL